MSLERMDTCMNTTLNSPRLYPFSSIACCCLLDSLYPLNVYTTTKSAVVTGLLHSYISLTNRLISSSEEASFLPTYFITTGTAIPGVTIFKQGCKAPVYSFWILLFLLVHYKSASDFFYHLLRYASFRACLSRY